MFPIRGRRCGVGRAFPLPRRRQPPPWLEHEGGERPRARDNSSRLAAATATIACRFGARSGWVATGKGRWRQNRMSHRIPAATVKTIWLAQRWWRNGEIYDDRPRRAPLASGEPWPRGFTRCMSDNPVKDRPRYDRGATRWPWSAAGQPLVAEASATSVCGDTRRPPCRPRQRPRRQPPRRWQLNRAAAAPDPTEARSQPGLSHCGAFAEGGPCARHPAMSRVPIRPEEPRAQPRAEHRRKPLRPRRLTVAPPNTAQLGRPQGRLRQASCRSFLERMGRSGLNAARSPASWTATPLAFCDCCNFEVQADSPRPRRRPGPASLPSPASPWKPAASARPTAKNHDTEHPT